MTVFKPQPKDTDAAYLAGLIDADGCISIFDHKRGSNVITLMLANSNIPTLEYLQSLWGGNVSVGPNKVNGKQYKDIGRLRWGSQAIIVDILYAIRPYMNIKSKQADLMLEWCQSRQNRPSHTAGYTERENEIAEQFRSLNK